MTRTFHILPSYLPPSQIWLFHLLKHTQNVAHHIASIDYLENGFDDAGFKFVPNEKGFYRKEVLQLPLNSIRNYGKRFYLEAWKLFNDTEIEQWATYIFEQKIDLIHCHFAQTACRYAQLAQQTQKPLIVSFYGHDYEQIPHTKPKYKARYQKLFKVADRFLCEGPHGKNILIEMGCAEEKITVLPLGIDCQKVAQQVIKTKKEESLKLLQVADFTFKKGQLLVIEALAALSQTEPFNFQMTFVGNPRDQVYFDTCMQKIETYGLQDKIQHLPFVPYAELPKRFAAHDYFIHPSLYAPDRDCEGGAPVILLDAQLYGMPIIGSQHCDIPNVVAPENLDLLVPENDTLALQNIIKKVFTIPENDFQKRSSAARGFVQTHFHVEDLSERLVKIYQPLKHIDT